MRKIRLQAIYLALLLGLLLVWLLPGPLPAAGPPGSRAQRKTLPPGLSFGWSIHNTHLLDPGKTIEIKEGTLITGYTLTGMAISRGAAPVRRGAFRLTLTIFSPREDLPGQQAGQWYVRGNWSITDHKATEEALKARHSPKVVKGTLEATLPFNPATRYGLVNAMVKLPYLASGGGNGKGTFSGNEKFEGDFDLALRR